MKKIISIILVVATLLSLGSCGKKQENSEVTLEFIKDWVWVIEAIYGVTIQEVSVGDIYRNSDKDIERVKVFVKDLEGAYYSIRADLLDADSDNEAEALLAKCATQSNFILEGHFGPFKKEEVDFKSNDIDCKWVTEKLQEYRSKPDAKTQSIERLCEQGILWGDCIIENNLFVHNGRYADLESLSYTGYKLFVTLRYQHFLLGTIEDSKKICFGEDPLYRYFAIESAVSAIPALKNDLIDPNSLQVHSQNVRIYRGIENYIFEVETDCTVKTSSGGVSREKLKRYFEIGTDRIETVEYGGQNHLNKIYGAKNYEDIEEKYGAVQHIDSYDNVHSLNK